MTELIFFHAHQLNGEMARSVGLVDVHIATARRAEQSCCTLDASMGLATEPVHELSARSPGELSRQIGHLVS